MYEEDNPLVTLVAGIFFVTLLCVIVSSPGWIAALVWGWRWFGRAILVFWISVGGLAAIITLLQWIGYELTNPY